MRQIQSIDPKTSETCCYEFQDHTQQFLAQMVENFESRCQNTEMKFLAKTCFWAKKFKLSRLKNKYFITFYIKIGDVLSRK